MFPVVVRVVPLGVSMPPVPFTAMGLLMVMVSVGWRVPPSSVMGAVWDPRALGSVTERVPPSMDVPPR